jgi:hypothetical protein
VLPEKFRGNAFVLGLKKLGHVLADNIQLQVDGVPRFFIRQYRVPARKIDD